MRIPATLCLAILALALTASAQKAPTVDPNQSNFAPQRRPGAKPKVRPNLQAAEQNKAVVRQVFDDLFTRGRYDLIDKVYARDCVVHHNNRDYKLEESVAEGKGWRSAAPDLQMTADDMKVEGNVVSVSWTARGTHTGKGNGLMKPTGKHILVHGNSRFRVVNGKIAEVWNNYNRNDIFRQLGVSPTMAYFYDETEGLRLAVSRMFTGPLPAQPK
jgi:predicted ester cyclase